MVLSQDPQHRQLFPPFQPLTCLDDLPITSSITDSVSTIATDTVSYGLSREGSLTMHTRGSPLTMDFLGIDDAGEVEELQMPLCATSYQGHSIDEGGSRRSGAMGYRRQTCYDGLTQGGDAVWCRGGVDGRSSKDLRFGLYPGDGLVKVTEAACGA
jgi:hypothetical protein